MEFEDICEAEDMCVDLSSQGITVIPQLLLQERKISILNFNFNDIESIPSFLCQNFKNLSSLHLSGNQITCLPDDIEQLSNLNELFINENVLLSLPQNIGNLLELRKLHCMGNQLKSLPASLSNLGCLKELLISENLISSLPEHFGNLHELEIFDASFNKINNLPQNFGDLTNLRNLNLASNNITCLPESFKNLPRMENCDISNNRISCFPEDFASTHCLKTLYIDHNNLFSLPAWLVHAENITKLSFKGNQIQGSPFHSHFGIANKMLKYLDLRGNLIISLPENFYLLDSLEYLDLGSMQDEVERNRSLSNGNNLSELPIHFGSLGNLRDLHLDENWIHKLPEDFGNLGNLVSLDLNHNSLNSLPNCFCNLTSLEVCMLSMNDLKELPVEFGCLTKLKDLRLDNNKLYELPASFENLTELEILDLYCNNLRSIPTSISKMSKLKRLYLDENKFDVPRDEMRKSSYQDACRSFGNSKDHWRGENKNNHLVSDTSQLQTKASVNLEETQEIASQKLLNVIGSSLQTGFLINKVHKDSTEKVKIGSRQNLYNIARNENSMFNNSCSKMDIYSQDYGSDVSALENWENEINQDMSHDAGSVCAQNVLQKEVSILDANSECWDNEIFCENFHDACGNNGNQPSSGSEDWESEAIFDSCNGRKGIHKHPTKEKNDMFFFVPAEVHPVSVERSNVWFCADDGQFDDADS